MSTTGAQRLELYDRLKESIGGETAALLMESLPPMNLSEIATASDVERSAGALGGEMAQLRTELRGEMAELRAELRGEMAGLRGELRGDFAELRAEFKASTRHTIVTIVAAAMTVWLSVYLPAVL